MTWKWQSRATDVSRGKRLPAPSQSMEPSAYRGLCTPDCNPKLTGGTTCASSSFASTIHCRLVAKVSLFYTPNKSWPIL